MTKKMYNYRGGIIMKNLSAVGKKINLLRKESSLNQDLLSKYLNVDQSYISKVESGERELSLGKLEKLADLFCVEIKYFHEEDFENPRNSISFRTKNLNSEVLESVAKINKIMKNLKYIDSLSGEENEK